MFQVLFLAALLTPFTAFAGNENGNGGDAVVCRNTEEKIISVEFLDFYEARMMRKMKIDLGGPSLTAMEKVELALSRIEKFGPMRADAYKELAKKFMTEANFVSVALVDIPDSQEVFIPKDCVIEQVAVQFPPRFPEDGYYTINEEIWNLMDADNQAGLILHEIYYRDALTQKTEPHKNSIFVRYFNSVVASNKMASLKIAEYFELLKRVQLFGREMVQGVTIDEKHVPLFDENGFAKAIHGQALDLQGKRIPVCDKPVTFYTKEQVESFGNCREFEFVSQGKTIVIRGQPDKDPYKQFDNVVSFHPDGSLKRADIARARFSTEFSRVEFMCRFNPTWGEFYPGGKALAAIDYRSSLEHCKPLLNLAFRGRWYTADYRPKIYFDPEGRLKGSDGDMPDLESLEPESANLGGAHFDFEKVTYSYGTNGYYLQSGVIMGPFTVPVEIQGKTVQIMGNNHEIEFYETGSFREFKLAEDTELRWQNGSTKVVRKETWIKLDPNGLVERTYVH